MSSPYSAALSDTETLAPTPHDRLSKLIHKILAEATAISPDDSNLVHYAKEALQLIDGYDTYAEEMSSPPPKIVEMMLEDGKRKDWRKLHDEGKTRFELIPEMSAGAYEGVVLAQLAKLTKAKRILEIGMFIGTTTVSLALVPTVERITTLDIEPYLKENNEPYFREAAVLDKIDIRIGDAKEELRKLAGEGAQFDLVFIDADKPSYLTYFNLVLSSGKSLLAPSGVIVADNTAFQGTPWASTKHNDYGMHINEFNRAIRAHQELEVVLLPIEDGISIIRRKGE